MDRILFARNDSTPTSNNLLIREDRERSTSRQARSDKDEAGLSVASQRDDALVSPCLDLATPKPNFQTLNFENNRKMEGILGS